MSDPKLRLVQVNRRSLAIDGKRVVATFAGGTFVAMADGLVLFRDEQLGEESDLSLEEAHKLIRELQQVCQSVERFQLRVSGQLAYRPIWIEGVLWIEHRGIRRRFRASVKRKSRYPRRCETCGKDFIPNQTLYVDAGDEPRFDAMGAMLCDPCCQPTASGLRRVK